MIIMMKNDNKVSTIMKMLIIISMMIIVTIIVMIRISMIMMGKGDLDTHRSLYRMSFGRAVCRPRGQLGDGDG